jgi:tetratricopeptide (TPR) repeat protein
MLRKLASIAAAFVAIHQAVATGNPEAAFDRANREYDAGNFEAARKLYSELVGSRAYSSSLFCNLGNAHYRLDDKGAAMLNYERALALEPGQAEALSNLEFVRNQTGAKIERLQWFEQLLIPLGASNYALIAASSCWAALFCIAAAMLAKGRRTGALRIGVGSLSLICCYAVFALWVGEKQRTAAVVTARQAEARFAPADTARLMGALPAGSRVRVLADRGAWVYCALPDRSKGWVPARTIEKIRLPSS